MVVHQQPVARPQPHHGSHGGVSRGPGEHVEVAVEERHVGGGERGERRAVVVVVAEAQHVSLLVELEDWRQQKTPKMASEGLRIGAKE